MNIFDAMGALIGALASRGGVDPIELAPAWCALCRERKPTVPVRGGGQVCDWCALDVPISQLPRGWSL